MRISEFYIQDANGRQFPIVNPPVVSVRRAGSAHGPAPLPSFIAEALVEISSSSHSDLKFAKVSFQIGPALPINQGVVSDISLDMSFDASKMALPNGYSGLFDLGAAIVVEAPVSYDETSHEAFVYVPEQSASIDSNSSSVERRNAYESFGNDIVDPTVTAIEKISLGLIIGPLKIVHEEINITCAD